MKFSTPDNDQDDWSGFNCAEGWKGAWWYRNCYVSNLNGFQYSNVDDYKSIFWYHWKSRTMALKSTMMKMRRK